MCITIHSGHTKISRLSHREEEGWREETTVKRPRFKSQDNLAVIVATRLSIFTEMSGLFTAVLVATKQEVLSETLEQFPNVFMAIKLGIFNGPSG